MQRFFGVSQVSVADASVQAGVLRHDRRVVGLMQACMPCRDPEGSPMLVRGTAGEGQVLTTRLATHSMAFLSLAPNMLTVSFVGFTLTILARFFR